MFIDMSNSIVLQIFFLCLLVGELSGLRVTCPSSIAGDYSSIVSDYTYYSRLDTNITSQPKQLINTGFDFCSKYEGDDIPQFNLEDIVVFINIYNCFPPTKIRNAYNAGIRHVIMASNSNIPGLEVHVDGNNEDVYKGLDILIIFVPDGVSRKLSRVEKATVVMESGLYILNVGSL